MFHNDLVGKIKLIDSNFNAETGTSIVLIQTRLGIFKGESHLSPEDKKVTSKYAGCEYAEMRAVLKYLKAQQNKIKIQKETLLTLKNTNNFNSYTNRKIDSFVDDLNKDYSDIAAMRRNLSEHLKNKMQAREDYYKKLEEFEMGMSN